MIKYGVLSFLDSCLNENSLTVKHKALWAMSNISAGTKTQIQEIIKNKNLMEKLFDVLENGDANVS